MKITKKQVIKSVVFLGLLGGILAALSIFVFVPVQATNAYSTFYMEEKDSLDLTLIGNSTVMYGYSPGAAYGSRGITSHVIGSQPSHPEVTKIAITETYETQHPQAIFVDINGITFQSHDQQEYFVRNYYESMPDKTEEQKARKKNLAEKYKYLEYVDEKEFEFFANHNNFRNYENIIEASGVQKKLKGHKPTYGVASLSPVDIDPTKEVALNDDQSLYIEEFIAAAKNCVGTRIVFGRMPRFVQSKNVEDIYLLRSAKKMIVDAGFEYVDFSENVTDIIDMKDQRDDEHLNVYGAIKFSTYLVDYLNLAPKDKTATVTADFTSAYEYFASKYMK